MPLTENNFELTDGTLQYRIDQRLSKPAKLVIKPGAKETATVTVSQPIRATAITLEVTLNEYPFGKTSWLVAVPSSF